MTLVDTSVWADHIRSADPRLDRLLDQRAISIHPFVIGEVALGNLRHRRATLDFFQQLPRVEVATDREVLHLIDEHSLAGSGIGYVDAHLLAATFLTPETTLWTRDQRLRAVARRLGLAMAESLN